MVSTVLCKRARLKCRLIKDHLDSRSIAAMCWVLKVETQDLTSGFIVLFLQKKANQRLLGLKHDSHALSVGAYSYRMVHCDLRELGETCSRNRVTKIMKQNRIRAVHGYKIALGTIRRASLIVHNRLQREFTVGRPHHVWVTNITHLRSW